jgi:hypothetical protein
MPNSAHSRRRRFGTACLAGAAGLLILGQTLLKPYLDGASFIFYWLACILLTGLTLITALIDVQAVRRHAQEQQRDLLRDALKEVNRDGKGKSS